MNDKTVFSWHFVQFFNKRCTIEQTNTVFHKYDAQKDILVIDFTLFQ